VERIVAEIGGFHREWLFLPAPAGAPLVVVLTGTGGTTAWVDRETNWSKLAARKGFALAVPEAMPPNPAAPPSFLTNPPRWDDGSPPLLDLATSGPQPDDVEFLTSLIASAVNRGADSRRVFVTGFSNGAGMAFRLAAERADRITAIAPVAGHCWVPEPKPSRPVPTLYTVGTGDLLIPFRGGEVRLPWNNRLVRRPSVTESLERWAVALGCSPVSTVRREGTVRVDRYPGPVVFDAVIIEGLGHHWPGGRAQLNPRIAGPPSDAVNATEMIWDFFEQFS
jgi:polyhydroxybutyrate depolymerase